MGTRWGVVVGVAVAFSVAGIAAAQDQGSKDQDLETIKKRLDVLEQEKAQREADELKKAEHGADPADVKWYDKVHVGGGVRASFRSQEASSPSTNTYSYDFQLDDSRLYTGGKITDKISASLTADFRTGGAAVIDAIAEFTFQDEFNVFVGRMLPACDRSNSDGPYYLSSWDYPELSFTFTNAFGAGFGRDDGITLWGDIQKFKYWVGAYEGLSNGPGPNTADHLLYAARVQYDFLDPEKGYYLSSTYYGEKSILALGVAVNYQAGIAGALGDEKNELNLDIDALFEKKFDFGTPTVEVAYYMFKRGGYGSAGVGGLNNVAGALQLGEGQGILATVAFLIPGKIGWGEFQPFVRYQAYDEKKTDAKNLVKNNFDRVDLGVNYVMSGHNARISLVYSVMDHKDGLATDNADHLLTIGTQVQF